MENIDETKDKIRQILIKCRVQKELTQTDVGKMAKYYGKSIEYMYGEEDDRDIR